MDEPINQPEQEERFDKQSGIRKLPPHLWKKGQSGNPKGRPKGKTMKEYSRDYLASMTDEEREEFMEGIPKEIIWKMAEGMPDTKNETKLDKETIQAITGMRIVKDIPQDLAKTIVLTETVSVEVPTEDSQSKTIAEIGIFPDGDTIQDQKS